MGVVSFPRQPPREPLPEPLQRELGAIAHWLAAARRSLHARPYAEPDDHDALVRICTRMRAAVFSDWHAAQPRGRR